MLKLRIGALLMGLLLVMNSCQLSESAMSEAVTMIPQSAAMVMCVNVDNLKAQVPEGSFSSLPFMENANTDSELLQMLFNDSLMTGIDEQELLLFSMSEAQFGGALLLNDELAFEKVVKQLIYEAELSVQIAVEEQYKSCVLDSVVLVWNTTKALVLSSCDKSTALSYFTQGADQSIASHRDFKAFYAERKELSFWMSMENQADFMALLPQYKQAMAMNPMANIDEMYQGVYASYHISFLPGELLMTGKMTPEDKASEVIAEYYNDKPSERLLSAIPGESYLLMTGAMNLQGFLKIYKEIPQFQAMLEDPKAEAVIQSLQGDVVFSISGFAAGPMPIPNAVVGLSVEDEKLLEMLLDIDGVQTVEKDGYTALVIQMFQVFVAQNDNILLLSTDENVIKSFAQGEKLDHSLAQSEHKKALNSAAYYYMNLNLNDYPAALTMLLQGKVGDKFSQVNQAMSLDEVYAFYETSSCESEVHLTLKDKEKNSLTALVEMMQVILSVKE